MVHLEKQTSPADTRTVLKRFLQIFLMLALLIVVAVVTVYQTETHSAETIVKENELSAVNLDEQIIVNDFKNVISDVRFLAGLRDLQSLVNGVDEDAVKSELSDDLSGFVQRKQVYDRIRLFDRTGTELMRVNFGGIVVAMTDVELESKANRTDFDQTFHLNQDEIYASPFELNLDQPPKPTIRFGAPVFGSAGEKRGVLLIDYAGAVLLDDLKKGSNHSAGDVMLLNVEGDWLKGPTPADEWGFMRPDGKSRTFGNAYPRVGPQITREAGQVADADGLFTFVTVYPLAEGLQSANARAGANYPADTQIGSRDYKWKIVSRVPSSVLATRAQHTLVTLIPLALVALLILAFGSHALARALVRRQRAEVALAEQFGFLEKMLDTMPNPVYYKDTRGVYRGCNRAYEDFYGVTRTRLVGKTAADIHPPEIAARYHELDQALLREPGTQQQEARALRADGVVRDIFLSKATYTNTEGRLTGIVGVILDITERKQMEAQVARLKQFNENIVQSIGDGIVMDDADGQIAFVNPAAEAMLGYAAGELGGQHWSVFIPADQQQVVRHANATRAAGEKSQYELQVMRKDGARVTVLVSGKPRFENAKYVGTLAVFTDITARKAAEDRLRQLSRAVEQSPVSIIITDTNGCIEYVNPRFTQVTGYTLEEALGRNPRILSSGETPREEYKKMWDTIKGGGEYHGEFHNKKKNGELYWDALSISAITDDKGQVTHFLAVKEDTTLRKQAEIELQKAKDAAEKAMRAKGEFLANMSHEIRTPMNAVIGMTSLLLDTPLNAQQREFCETIRASGDGLLSIINEILDFSKIESGNLELERQPFELSRCVEESLDLVVAKASEKGLDLAYTIADQAPDAIFGDSTRLRQILVNLLSNAVKFTERGEVVLSVTTDVSTSVLGPSSPVLHFSVRDTGIGIPPERVDRLFKSFSQVDASTTRRFGGTGLGLVISKRLAELMGGEMWVESEGIPGKGATFHFTIQAQAAPMQPGVNLRAVQPHLEGLPVLIVDDNATNRQILTLQLQAWGMKPRAAASGPTALEWLARGARFDLAILDMQMPEMDGVALAVEIRKLRDARALPLVMLTSVGSRAEAERSTEPLFAAFLRKPVKPSLLYNALVDLLAQRPTRAHEPVARAQIDSTLGARHPLRILLAEDNLVNQKVALLILQKMGYRADVAANGIEALDALARQPYDVVLMDAQMPELDGLEATRRIRQTVARARQPRIIAMTAEAMQGDREICLAAGMDDYVAKPVRVEELVNALERVTPREAANQAGALDARVLTDLCDAAGGEMQIIAELVDLFQANAPTLIEQLRQAIDHQDVEGLRRAAHTLKSASANLGARGLATLCKTLEEQVKSGKVNGAGNHLAQVEEEYARALDALRNYIKG